MGLNTTHGAWDGAYSAFGRWRDKLAEVAGMPPLDFMEGFFEVDMNKAMVRDGVFQDRWSRISNSLPIRWDALKRDPLHALLNHSDCDGSLYVRQLPGIIRRLKELLPLLPDEDGGGHIGNWRDKTQTFIDGCELALRKREAVRFH